MVSAPGRPGPWHAILVQPAGSAALANHCLLALAPVDPFRPMTTAVLEPVAQSCWTRPSRPRRRSCSQPRECLGRAQLAFQVTLQHLYGKPAQILGAAAGPWLGSER